MLEIRDLHVKFHTRQREAVAGVSLTIHDGEILGLVGESGSGKSVTAMSVAGLLPRKQCDFSGEILLDGTELLHADRTLLRQVQGREIGVVFQEPQSCMDPLMRIGPQVEEVLRIHTDLSREARRDQALAALAAVELPDPAGVYRKYPHELSGGMLQRAMIAAAVVARPKLLLLDEPTTALDVTIQAQILELLKKLNRESGISMLFISHNLNVVRKLCTRTAVMQRGVLVEEGDIETVFRHPRHPYTQRLIAALEEESLKYETYFKLNIATGMRRGECCGLQWGDINWQERSIHIQRNVVKVTGEDIIVKETKTVAGDRYVYFSLEMESLLKEFQRECAWETETYDGRKLEDTDYIFRRHGARLPMTPSTFTWRFKLILKKHGLPTALNVHSLRHTNASLLIAGGADVATVAGLLGHSQPSTTLDIYTHAFDKNKKAASQVLQEGLEI